MPLNVPPIFGAYDAVNKGMADSNALAQQRAQAILAQIKAQRENEIIDAELLNNKLRTEAYAKQVAQMNQPKTKQETQKSQAEAGLVNQQSQYAPLQAISILAKTNPAAYSEYINRPENEDLKKILGDQFNQEATQAYLQGIMPNNPTKLRVADTTADAARGGHELRYLANKDTVEGRHIDSKIAADSRVAAAGARPTKPSAPYENDPKYIAGIILNKINTVGWEGLTPQEKQVYNKLIEMKLLTNPASQKPGPMQLEGINREPSAAEKFRSGGAEPKADPLGIR